jgi:hypothetical protein
VGFARVEESSRSTRRDKSGVWDAFYSRILTLSREIGIALGWREDRAVNAWGKNRSEVTAKLYAGVADSKPSEKMCSIPGRLSVFDTPAKLPRGSRMTSMSIPRGDNGSLPLPHRNQYSPENQLCGVANVVRKTRLPAGYHENFCNVTNRLSVSGFWDRRDTTVLHSCVEEIKNRECSRIVAGIRVRRTKIKQIQTEEIVAISRLAKGFSCFFC